MTFNADWEDQAENWLAWARTPGHDVYWHYRDAFYALVPPAGSATLEVGCGEGRVARDLAAHGHRVTGVDASPTLLAAAAAAHAGGLTSSPMPRTCRSTTPRSISSSLTTR